MSSPSSTSSSLSPAALRRSMSASMDAGEDDDCVRALRHFRSHTRSVSWVMELPEDEEGDDLAGDSSSHLQQRERAGTATRDDRRSSSVRSTPPPSPLLLGRGSRLASVGSLPSPPEGLAQMSREVDTAESADGRVEAALADLCAFVGVL
eukprot:PLAT11296.1.p3 GENE.PLAT11296.1~~PLAT11296.1.p3  ORF type:complete len:150 (-),score=29.66 PLAT11296.1:40-489(-)